MTGTTTAARRTGTASGWWWVLPALTLYGAFVLYPLSQTVRYSFYDWDGFGPATWVGLENYRSVVTDERLLGSIGHALVLIAFFTVLPIAVNSSRSGVVFLFFVVT